MTASNDLILNPSNRPEEATLALLVRTRLWQPNPIVFVSSGCIMTLELVAGRIIAPYVGVSLYTWTSVIGVVLAGISLGNYLGGRLADRQASIGTLVPIFLLAGVSCFGILGVDALGRLISGYPPVLEILVLTIVLFFVPCVILGTITPVVAKLTVRDLTKTGSTVGKLYAAGAIGSIVGTFATGFVLISWFGTYAIVCGVAMVLLTMSLLFSLGSRWQPIAISALVIAGGSILALNQGWLHAPCSRETNYYCIKVHEEKRGGDLVQVLTLDRLEHSCNCPNDPTKLVYSYEQMLAEATAYQAQQDDHLRALFVGGGGYTFPRYMEAVYPGSDIHVIEIDPGVTEVAYDMLGLSPDTNIVTYNQDARFFLAQKPVEAYDLIVGDAFNDRSVPYHLTTKEFNNRVHTWLDDDGLYVVHIFDSGRGDFLRAYTHTLRQSFRNVYLAPTLESWRQSSSSTFVLIATDTPLDLATGGGSLLAGQMLGQEEIDALLAEGRVVMLTDQYAPVEQMLAPMFRGEIPK